MYNLYYQPFSCSFAVHAALEKIGRPYTLHKVDLNKGEHQLPEFLNINSMAQVPVLEHKGKHLKQAGAILLHLSEQYPDTALLPELSSPDRAPALQMLFYLSNTIHPLFARLFYPERISKESKDDVKVIAIEKIGSILEEFNSLFSKQHYCVSNELYAPDYYLFAILNWLRLFQIDISNLPHLKAYIQRMKTHSEVLSTIEKEMKSFSA